jgi:hypothetical protein
MLLRKEDVEAMGYIGFGFSSLFRSRPRISEPLRRWVRAGRAKIGNSNRPRLGFPWDDVADLSARTMVYMLAMLGMLHALGQVAAAPRP